MKFKIDIVKCFFILILPFLFNQCKNKNERIENKEMPKIERVGKNDAVISWESKEVYEGVLYYKPTLKERGRPTSAKDSKESTHHKVVINDLSPSTTYNYWLKDSKVRYTFQTMPENSVPFSFMIAGGDSTEDYVSLINSERCGFLLSVAGKDKNENKNENSYLPVYNMEENVSDRKEEITKQEYNKLDWGDLHLVMLDKMPTTYSFLNSQESHTIGIIFKEGLLGGSEDEIKKSAFHQSIVNFNKKVNGSCGCPPIVAFIGIINFPEDKISIDGISYISIPRGKTDKNNLVIVSVDGESVSAYYPLSDKEIILRAAPEQSRKLCNECRRLADKGLYQKSIEAYKSFIEENSGKYLTEEAYLAVARILDEKLFRLKDASGWYKQVLELYPESNSAGIAKQRLRYFKKNSDFDYKPLEQFEKIKSEFSKTRDNINRQQGGIRKLSQQQKTLLAKAEEVIKQYPDCRTTKGIMFWVANQCQQADEEKALYYYNMLENKDKEFCSKSGVLLKMGETYNYAGQYKNAKLTLMQAQNESPEMNDAIRSQIKKSETNILRINIRNAAWIIAILIFLIALIIKPTGLKMPRFKPLFFISSAYIYTFIVVFFVLREEIKENFNSYNEILLFFILFNIALIVGLITSRTYSIKLKNKEKPMPKLLGAIGGSVVFIGLFYLIIFYVYQTYLGFINL